MAEKINNIILNLFTLLVLGISWNYFFVWVSGFYKLKNGFTIYVIFLLTSWVVVSLAIAFVQVLNKEKGWLSNFTIYPAPAPPPPREINQESLIIYEKYYGKIRGFIPVQTIFPLQCDEEENELLKDLVRFLAKHSALPEILKDHDDYNGNLSLSVREISIQRYEKNSVQKAIKIMLKEN